MTDLTKLNPGDRALIDGPWFCEKSTSDFWYITADPAPFSRSIGQTWGFDAPTADQEAIARLMSAAPELLEALKLARRICLDAYKDSGMEWDDESMAVIDAALAKAGGKA